MDCSSEYIKMCDCPEIQTDRHPSIGSIFWEPKMEEFGLFVLSTEKVQYQTEKPWREALLISLKDYRFINLDHHAIWLPRQDQLQEIVGSQIEQGRYCANEILPFKGGPSGEINVPDEFRRCDSWEQLWLAFVMKEKHGKVWQNGEWVK